MKEFLVKKMEKLKKSRKGVVIIYLTAPWAKEPLPCDLLMQLIWEALPRVALTYSSLKSGFAFSYSERQAANIP